jgi:hypothetical protein
MFRQNRTLKKSNQLWELVLTPREAIIVGRPFWPPINKRRASCAPLSTASCLRPTFTRFTIRLNRGRAQVVAPSLNLLECGGKRSATPLSSGSQGSRITWRTGGSHQVGKSAVAPSLCRRSPKSVTKDVAESIQATTRKRRSSESRKRFERNNCSEVSSVSSRALRKLSIAA